jgi:peroxiredoxin Q/BCP
MPVELRKRKAAAPPPAPAPKKTSKAAKVATKAKEAITGKPADTKATNGSAKPVVGDIITLEGFGGEIETNDGKKTTLKTLVEESGSGVVLFTYPKASTPGCK